MILSRLPPVADVVLPLRASPSQQAGGVSLWVRGFGRGHSDQPWSALLTREPMNTYTVTMTSSSVVRQGEADERS